jgi:hypothetical protein
VKFRLDIVLSERGSKAKVWSSKYLKWFAAERGALFEQITYAEAAPTTWHLGLIPKTGDKIAARIVDKLFHRSPLAYSVGSGSDPVYLHRVMTMFIKCFDFVPYFRNEVDGIKKSEDYKPFRFRDQETAGVALAVLNSSAFFYYFVLFGDCFHCGKEFVESFPAGLNEMSPPLSERLRSLGAALMIDLKKHAVRKAAVSRVTGRVEYDEFWPRHSKAIIDDIDTALATHYGFSDEELDFIVNYDIKYRLGAVSDEE